MGIAIEIAYDVNKMKGYKIFYFLYFEEFVL